MVVDDAISGIYSIYFYMYNNDNIITTITITMASPTTSFTSHTSFTASTTYSTFILLYINMSNNEIIYRSCSKTKKTITTTSHERTKTMKINITSMTARNTANASPLEEELESADKARVEELLRDVEDKIVDSDAFTGETPETTVSEFYDEDGLCILSVTETPNKAVFNFHLANEEYELLPTK